MRAIAEHDVEQQHRDARIRERCGDVLVAQLGLDHRMRPAARVAIVAEIEACAYTA